MYGKASALAQSRARRAAGFADTTGGIEASDAFKKPSERDVLEAERLDLTTRLRSIQNALHALNDHRALQDVQRQISHLSPVYGRDKSHKALRARLVEENQAIVQRLSELKPLLRRHNIADSQHVRATFESVFLGVAKEMLAEPVYLRLLAEAQHRCGRERF